MITVYGKNNCKYCNIVKMFLEANKAEFEYKNIDEDEEYAKEFYKLDVMGAPATLVDGEVLLGWNDDIRMKLANYLGL